jgi:hypothetical protein
VFSIRLNQTLSRFGQGVKLGEGPAFWKEKENDWFLTSEGRSWRDSENSLEGFTHGFCAGKKGISLFLIKAEGDEGAVRELGTIGGGEDGRGTWGCALARHPGCQQSEESGVPKGSPHGG